MLWTTLTKLITTHENKFNFFHPNIDAVLYVTLKTSISATNRSFTSFSKLNNP